MQTITFDLPRLLKLIQEDKFQIPQFQRPFRWRAGQVKLLLDSLVRGYPVGSLLVMGKNSKMPLKARTIEATIQLDESAELDAAHDDPQEIKEGYLVLDGQQRITSIARIFLNADSKKSYYVDLKEMLQTFSDSSDASEDLPWIKSYTKGKKDPERKNNNRWIRADLILNAQKSSIYITEYVEDSGDFQTDKKEEQRKKAARLSELFEVVRKYQVPIVVIDADVGIDSVCRVFETINSTGTRLTTFDLAVARFFPKPDLRSLLNTSKDQYPVLKEFDIDGDRILQVLALSSGYNARRTPEPSRGGLLALDRSYLDSHWDGAAKALQAAYNWVKGQGARTETLPNSGIVVAIAGMLLLKPNVFERTDLNFSSTLRRWYFSRILKEGGSGGASTRMSLDFLNLMYHLEKDEPLDFPNVLLTANNIERLTSTQDNRYKAIQCILALSATEDLLTQEKIGQDTILEHHHIFPRSYAKKNGWGSKVESIANIIATSKRTNREISDKEPREYFSNLSNQAKKNGTIRDLRRRLEISLIPFWDQAGDSGWASRFELSAFEQFLAARASILHRKIGELIGPSLIDKESPDADADPDAA